MNFQISLALLLAASVISFQDEYGGYNETARKHYGLSFHSKCTNYVKSFTCMTTCKSIGFQVYRMDFRCKCSCHGLKTTTILPFFKWRTNGTTKALPKTQSPNLYHIAGTLSPAPTESTEETSTPAPPVTCAPPEPTTLTASNDTNTNHTTTSVDDESATTGDATNNSDTSDPEGDGGATTEAEGDDTTSAVGDGTTDAVDDGTTAAVDNDTNGDVDDGTTVTVGDGTNDGTTLPDDTTTTEGS